MYIGIDDTDSRGGGCSTYVLTEIIRRTGLDLMGFPRLVRLNPAVPWKTRGNGALSACIGKGHGNRAKIGEFNGIPLYAYDEISEAITAEDLLETAAMTVYDLAELMEEETNPGIVVGENLTDPSIYERCVRGIADVESVTDMIGKSGHLHIGIKNGRGLIGAAAALSWIPRTHTYEAILYRYPHPDPVPYGIRMAAAEEADGIEGTFNNIDRANFYAAIFPRERTPVILGIRGLQHRTLLESAVSVAKKFSIPFDRAMVFETNQATDDHIESNPDHLENIHSYHLQCRVTGSPYSIRGSHWFVELDYNGLGIRAAAFEPTKEFRKVFSQLSQGDAVDVYGTYSDNVLNVEKMEVISLSRIFLRKNPQCERCHIPAENHGRNDFRCPVCGTRYFIPHYSEMKRNIQAGRYNVPVIARRHLSRPFFLEADP